MPCRPMPPDAAVRRFVSLRTPLRAPSPGRHRPSKKPMPSCAPPLRGIEVTPLRPSVPDPPLAPTSRRWHIPC